MIDTAFPPKRGQFYAWPDFPGLWWAPIDTVIPHWELIDTTQYQLAPNACDAPYGRVACIRGSEQDAIAVLELLVAQSERRTR